MFVTFDLDGTLADSPFGKVVLPWMVEELRRLGVEEPFEKMRDEQHRRFAGDRRVEGLDWDGVARAAAESVGALWPHSLARVMAEDQGISGALRSFPLFEDVPPVLELVRARGLGMAVVTNGHVSYQRVIFEHMGVADRFDLLLGPDVLRTVKPDPAVFRHPALSGGVGLHVGDLLSQDVRAARLAGIPGVLVARPPAGDPEWSALRGLSPRDRPQAAMEGGVLSRRCAVECEFLRIPASAGEEWLQSGEAVPDAIILSFSELPALLGDFGL